GVVETPEALRMADQAGMDLVEISPDARPPVCKIMDYGKFKYEQSKKDQANRAASKTTEMKEVRLGRSVKIDPHDGQIRVDQAPARQGKGGQGRHQQGSRDAGGRGRSQEAVGRR